MSTPIQFKFYLVGVFLLIFSSLQSQIFVNEWMSKNETILADGQNEFDDWIEIYNAGTEDINLGGYYFTDKPSQPNLWRIPENQPEVTTVPAGGFLILWADKDILDGANHLDFKLSNSGDSIAIFQETTNGFVSIDMVSYSDQSNDVSMGRLFDGQSDLGPLPAPSPNASNGEFILPTTYTSSISSTIIDPNDDAEQTTNSMILDSYHLELVDDWANQLIGLRFQQLNIPQGATIVSAHVQFSVDTEHTGACNLVVQCQDTDDASSFSSSNHNISNRSRTTASVNWSPEDWIAEFVADSAQRTPNLAPIVEEVVQRSGWEEGNDMVFIFSGMGTREAVAYEYKQERAAKLYITYENTITPTPVNDLYINEIAANGSEYLNESDDYSDWIELYNGSNQSQEIQGLFLSDNPNNLLKWAINKSVNLGAGEFAVINADEDTKKEQGLHANFKLGKNGETVFLTQVINNEIILLDSVSYPPVPFKATYGRTVDGGANWTLFGLSTPVESNLDAEFYLAPATIFPPSGVFVNSVENITLTHEDPSAVLRYTTDGSVPSASDDIYSGPFGVNENAVIRVKAFKNGFVNNVTPLATYLVDMEHDLPILTISTDPDNLFDDEIGIYVEGSNGTSFDFCGDNPPANYINNWERPASIALYEPDGMKAFEVNAGIKIAGACSRYNDLKSMNVYLRPNQYGDDKIAYQIFPDRNRDKFKRLKIRSSGQDFQNSMMRDGTLHNITGEILDMDYQAYRPAVVYMNGEYWGIMNMRELYGGKYFDDHHDISEDDIDLIKNPRLGNEIKEGDDVAFNYLFNFVEFNDLTNEENYEWVKSKIDMDNFINYWATMVYLSCSDWPANNLMVWRPHESDGKFRWVIIDTDASTSAYGIQGNTSYSYDMLDKVNRADAYGWPNDAKSTLFFRKLLENEEFKNEYIQRSMSIMEIIYSAERTNQIISASAARINSEIPNHIDRWIDDLPYLQTHTKWLSRVERLKEFFELRPENWVGILDDFFTLDGTYDLTFNYDETTPGDVFVNWNKIKVPFNHTNTYFENIPLTVSVEAHEGYEFLYWLETGETETEIQYSANTNSTLTPIFLEVAIAAQINGPQGVCIGEEAELEVVAQNCENCTFTWQDGFTGATRTVLPVINTTYTVTISNEDGSLTSETVHNIEVNSLPLISVNTANSTCFGEDNGHISLTPNSAATPFTYEWETGEESDELSNLASGSYFVTFTDANNCSTSQQVTITEPSILNSEIEVENVICPSSAEGSIQLNIVGGVSPYSFEWSNNGEDMPNQENLTAGTYDVIVRDANNCELELQASISAPADFELESTIENVLCNGDETGRIQIEFEGGTAPYQYSWDTGATGLEITNLEADSYEVTILDDNDCLFTEEFTVSSPEPIISTIETTNLLCNGDENGAIDLTLEGGVEPYYLTWNTGDETEDLEDLIEGDYMATVIDANDCILEFGTNISVPNPILIEQNISSISCNGEEDGQISIEIEGGTQPYEIAWENGENSEDLTNLSSGIYIATITDENDCMSAIEVEIVEPELLVVEMTTSEMICFGTTDGFAEIEVVGGTGDISFEWNTGDLMSSINGLSAGFYEVTMTDESQCTIVDSFEIVERAEIILTDQIADNDCFGQEEGSISVITTGGDNPFSFSWNTGQTTAAIMNLEAGDYFLTLTDANGCVREGEYTINTPAQILVEPTLVLPENGNNGSIDLEIIGGVSPYSFSWSNDSEEQNQTNLSSGLYTVTISDANNCRIEQTFDLSTTDIDDLKDLTSFDVYPNPNNGVFTINAIFENSVKGELRVINAIGQVLFVQDFSGIEWNEELKLNNLTSGMYWIQINTELGTRTKKVIVEN